jgi:outer membrane protein assembly factor BamD (BamD/ComL family)
MEEENYEEALNKLEELKDAQLVGSEYEALKEKIIEKLINHERNRAARLFLAAKEMKKDATKKKEYLETSYNILRDLIKKYPSSPLNKKLQSHISKVREALDKLGMQPKS